MLWHLKLAPLTISMHFRAIYLYILQVFQRAYRPTVYGGRHVQFHCNKTFSVQKWFSVGRSVCVLWRVRHHKMLKTNCFIPSRWLFGFFNGKFSRISPDGWQLMCRQAAECDLCCPMRTGFYRFWSFVRLFGI